MNKSLLNPNLAGWWHLLILVEESFEKFGSNSKLCQVKMDPLWQIINFKRQNCQPTTGLLLVTSRAPVFPKLIECTVVTHYKRAVDSSNKSKYFKPANYTAVSPNTLKPLIVVLIKHKPIFQIVN